MAGTRFTFKATNLKDIASRVDKFVRSVVNGGGATELRDESERVVIDEYKSAFDRGGFPGNPWKTTKQKVSLRRTRQFEGSFSSIDQQNISSRGSVLIIQFANAYIHPRMSEPYIAAMRNGIELSEKHSIELDISGNAGGISKTGKDKLFKAFRQIVSREAIKAGYK